MNRITDWFNNRKIQKDAENELVDTIIKSMTEEADKWEIDGYHASFGRLKIWITNSPYSDMTINDRRLPRRGELRKALAYCQLIKAKSKLLTNPL